MNLGRVTTVYVDVEDRFRLCGGAGEWICDGARSGRHASLWRQRGPALMRCPFAASAGAIRGFPPHASAWCAPPLGGQGVAACMSQALKWSLLRGLFHRWIGGGMS